MLLFLLLMHSQIICIDSDESLFRADDDDAHAVLLNN